MLSFLRSVLLILLLSAGTARAGGVVTSCTQANLEAVLKDGGLVTLSCDGPITLTSTIIISTNVTLDGAGRGVTISGENSVRLFQVNPGVTFVLKNLTLANGKNGASSTNSPPGITGQAGAIYNDRGTVVLMDCNLSGHSAVGGNGASGADSASSGGDNGGIGGSGLGGAIYNNGGTLVVTNSVFSGNRVAGGLGGNGGRGGSSGNGGYGGRGGDGGASLGGAIYNSASGLVQIFDSTFLSNQVSGAIGGLGGVGGGGLGLDGRHGLGSPGSGGAIFNAGGTVQISSSTFLNNSAIGVTGNNGDPNAGGSDGEDGQAGSSASGGALANNGGILTITNSTVFANILVGGNGGNGGNGGAAGFGGDGGDGGGGGNASGAGLYNAARGTATVINCTFVRNVARGGNGGAPGQSGGPTGRPGDIGSRGNPTGAGVFNELGTVALKNTIIAENLPGGNGGGVLEDGGNNLSSDDSAAFHLATSFNNTEPRLGAFGNNGGRTQTVALTSLSPAIDAGNDSVCPPTDQRHTARIGKCDIGAYEFNGVLPPLLLEVRRQNPNQVVVAWPASATGAILESTFSLSSPAIWHTVTNAPVLVTNQNTVQFPVTNQTQFFRLRQP